MLWSAAAAVLLTFSLAGGYFLTPTNAAEGPARARAQRPPVLVEVRAGALPQTGAAGQARALPRQPATAAAPSVRALKPESASVARRELQPAATRDAAGPDGRTRVPAAREAAPEAALSKPKAVASAKTERVEAPAAKQKSAPDAREPRASADAKASADEKPVSEAPARELKRAQAAEAKLLFAAERNYRGGAPELALEMVANHTRQYPRSGLAIEREVLRAQVLCALSRHRDARRIVADLEANNATPAVLDAVERACRKGGK
jgi:hypothetical protein